MKTYEEAPPEVRQRAFRLIEKFHAELHDVEVTIDFLFATNDNGHAVTHAGYPALAQCRIMPLKDRAAGRMDAEIVIDACAYDKMAPEQRDALLDHELEHLIPKRNQNDDDYLRDDLNRPKLRMKKHDYQMGWFQNIAERHGMNSVEVTQAKMLWDESGQAFFPMLTDLSEGGDADRMKRIDAALTEPSAAVKKAVQGFQKIAKDAGATVTIQTGDQSVTIGGK